jgi:hypothetical protein
MDFLNSENMAQRARDLTSDSAASPTLQNSAISSSAVDLQREFLI